MCFTGLHIWNWKVVQYTIWSLMTVYEKSVSCNQLTNGQSDETFQYTRVADMLLKVSPCMIAAL